MSWSRLGAIATGVDFSETAIELARSLSDELGLETRFIRSNVYDLPDMLDEQFDIVFTSYGVLNWLPDLDGWAEVIAKRLKPGGTFYIVEFHPFADVFEQSDSGDMVPAYDYLHNETVLRRQRAELHRVTSDREPDLRMAPRSGGNRDRAGESRAADRVPSRIPIQQLSNMAGVGAVCDDGWWRFTKHNESYPQIFSIRATK